MNDNINNNTNDNTNNNTNDDTNNNTNNNRNNNPNDSTNNNQNSNSNNDKKRNSLDIIATILLIAAIIVIISFGCYHIWIKKWIKQRFSSSNNNEEELPPPYVDPPSYNEIMEHNQKNYIHFRNKLNQYINNEINNK